MKPPPTEYVRREQITRYALGQHFGDEAQERALKSLFVEGLEIFLKRR